MCRAGQARAGRTGVGSSLALPGRIIGSVLPVGLHPSNQWPKGAENGVTGFLPTSGQKAPSVRWTDFLRQAIAISFDICVFLFLLVE